MYSAVLCKEDFLEVKKVVKEHSRKLEKILEKCNKVLLEYKRECQDEYRVMENIGALALQLMNLLGRWKTSWRGSRRKRCAVRCWNFLLQCGIFEYV